MSIHERTTQITWQNNQETLSYSHHKTLPSPPDQDFSPVEAAIVVKEILGEGGMGVVYKAIQDYPRREVAIKRLRPDSSHLNWALVQEAMVTGALAHPGTVSIHQLKLTGPNAPEVVMQCIKGTTLLEHIETFPPEERQLRELLNAMTQICNALEYAHSKNIIHRDIKPENIMLGDFGEVYLLDWGIAVCKDDYQSLPKGLVGTPAYMAPEMLSGDPSEVDQRTDIYLMGATLHEILTGSPKHDAQTLDKALHLAKESAPYEYPETIPVSLARLANQSCSQNPAERPQTIAEFRGAIERFLHNREATLLSRVAEKELDLLKEAIHHQAKGPIYRHFQRARFGFEHALTIWSHCPSASSGLEKALYLMIDYHLSKNNIALADDLVTALTTPSRDIIERLQVASSNLAQEQAEHTRLADIGSQNDPRITRGSRLAFFASLLVVSLIFLLFLFQIENYSVQNLTPDLLFGHSTIMLLPLLPILILNRQTLIYHPHGLRVSIGLGGGLCMIGVHRWFAFKYQPNVELILITDMLIFATALSNLGPAVRSGPAIAVAYVIGAFITYFYPATFWLAGLLLVLLTITLISWDWFYEWNRDNRPKVQQ